jgi:hypothetical protein
MTGGLDPVLADQLAQNQAEGRARSAEITEHVRATSQRIAEESRQLKEENEAFSKDLASRAEERAEAAKNQWARADQKDTTYHLGGAEVEEEALQQPAEPQVEATTRGRHARKPVEDDDDYSDHNWLG